jgi:tetratricopeptide (TPR) repeat protein
VLEAAALAAEPFAPVLLAPACALSELQAVIAIEEAVAARLLREHDAGGFAFAHDLVQQALNSALSDERRRLVHRRLALGADAAGAPAATIAAHHEASGDPARAVTYRLAAGDQAQRLHALQEAMSQWQKALADGPSAADAIRLRERLLLVGQQRADVDAVRAQADALGAMLEAGTLQANERIAAAVARAHALVFIGRQEQALAELDALPAAPEGSQRTQFLRVRSIALHNLGRADEAMVDAKAALARPDLPDRDRIELLDLAFISDHGAGRAESALAYADAALVLSQKIGHALGVARARYRRGIQRLQMNDVAGAELDLRTAAEESERLGFVNLQRIVLYNLSSLYALQGMPAQALDAARRGWSLEPPIQAPTMRAMFGLAMVDPQQSLGDLGAAWEAAQQVVVDALAQDDPTVRILSTVGVIEVLGLVGEAQPARRLLASIDDAALRELANVAGEMWVALAQFEIAQGDPAAATQALGRLDAAGGLVDPRVRVRCSQARAGLCLALGDAAGSLIHLPADDAVGMNDEMRLRGLALRLTAQARLGRPTPSTLAAASQACSASSGHRLALLALQRARVEAATTGADPSLAEAVRERHAFVEALAQTLHHHPVQQAAFRRNTT